MWQIMPYGYEGGYGAMHGGGWLGFGLHSLLWILVIAAAVALVIWAIRSNNGGSTARQGNARPSALEILDERYARGEIDREDYQARKADLEGG